MLQFKIILVCAACVFCGCVSGNSNNDAVDDAEAIGPDLSDLTEVFDLDITADASDLVDAADIADDADIADTVDVTVEWSCPVFGTPTIVGNLDSYLSLKEASGLVASRKHPGILWSHNDSNDSDHVYAVLANSGGGLVDPGTIVYEYTFTNIKLIDQEDIAIGPFAGIEGDAIFIADVGDNNYQKPEQRNFVTVYVFAEPAEPAEIATRDIAKVVRIDVKYPDGAHDCEAFFVDPLTGDFYFVAKESNSSAGGVYTSTVYRKAAPHAAITEPAGEPVELTKIAEIPTATVTGADISADGLLLLIRGYYGGLYFQRELTDSVEKMLAGKSCELPVFSVEPYFECQGEAIAFAPDNSGFYSVSEYRKDCLQNINFTPLNPAR